MDLFATTSPPYAPVIGAASQVTKSGYYSMPAGARSSAAPILGGMTFLPLHLTKAVTVDRIFAEVTAAGAATAVVRLGIYDSASDGSPGSLILDAGTIDGTVVAVQQITINQALAAGRHWLAAVTQSVNCTCRLVSSVTPEGMVSSQAADLSLANLTGFLRSGTAAALPASASPTSAVDRAIAVGVRFA